jgi:hypothetical protein
MDMATSTSTDRGVPEPPRLAAAAHAIHAIWQPPAGDGDAVDAYTLARAALSAQPDGPLVQVLAEVRDELRALRELIHDAVVGELVDTSGPEGM